MDRRSVLKTLGTAAGTAVAGVGLGSPAWSQQSGPIKLGLISSLTGSQAPLGQANLLGAQIAVDQINQAGGVGGRKLELVARDDKAKPADAAVAARELIGSGINCLAGAASSAVALAISAMLAQEKAVFISTAAHSDKLTKENYVRNFFRGTDNPYMRQRAQAKLAAERYGDVIRWSGVIPDHDYGRTTWSCFEDGLVEYYPSIAKKKPSIVAPVKTQYGAADYRNSIAAAMGVEADGFMVSVYGGDAVTLYKQAAPYGFFKKAKVIMDSANELIVAKAMKHELPDMWIGSHWFPGAFEDVEMSRNLYAEAVRRTGDRLQLGFLCEGHAAIMAYARAIQEAGSTQTDAVISALESVKYETGTGTRHFRNEDHQVIKPVVIHRLRGNAKATDGFDVLEVVKIPGADVVDPATPGVAIKYRTA